MFEDFSGEIGDVVFGQNVLEVGYTGFEVVDIAVLAVSLSSL